MWRLTNVLMIAIHGGLLLFLLDKWKGSSFDIAILVISVFVVTWCSCQLLFSNTESGILSGGERRPMVCGSVGYSISKTSQIKAT